MLAHEANHDSKKGIRLITISRFTSRFFDSFTEMIIMNGNCLKPIVKLSNLENLT